MTSEEPVAYWTVDYPNEIEKVRLDRRGISHSQALVIVLTFVDLTLDQLKRASQFANITNTSADWSTIAPVLPVRLSDAAKGHCILHALDRDSTPQSVRLVIKKSARASIYDESNTIEAIKEIANEMNPYSLGLVDVRPRPSIPQSKEA